MMLLVAMEMVTKDMRAGAATPEISSLKTEELDNAGSHRWGALLAHRW